MSLNTSSGSANCVIELPKFETVSPVQNFQKSARIARQRNGSRAHTSVVPDTLDRYLEQHGDRFVSELRELCAIPSEATDEGALDAAARWCGERLVSAGAEAHELRAPGAPALVVGEVGAGKRTLICVQHYDVQPAVPLGLWDSPPYDPTVRDGAVFARGVDDNKGHLLLRIQ
ncbi:MAG: M20/M25/M40 family metallo-hydrolase, partial [Chloroflexi bacterium]